MYHNEIQIVTVLLNALELAHLKIGIVLYTLCTVDFTHIHSQHIDIVTQVRYLIFI